MSKSLVIVESPAKAKTISKYLGSDFRVESSVGHIRDLPRSSQKQPRKASPKFTSIEEKEKYEILSFLSQLKPPFYQRDLQGLLSLQIPFFQLFSLHDYSQFAGVSG